MAHIRRRNFVAAVIGACSGFAPWLALAQPRSVRIGYLSPRQRSAIVQPILQRLGELGYVQGKNLSLEYRSADGVEDRFPSLARELIEAKCDLIFAVGTASSARALVDAKAPVPIVIAAIDYDPVGAGIVSNLRRPGGNVTGVTMLAHELVVKQVEILRELLPQARRLLLFSDPFSQHQLEPARKGAERLRVETIPVAFQKPPYGFDPAFEQGRKAGADALLLLTSPVFVDQRETIYSMAMKRRLPVVVGWSAYWDGSGWLMGYGPKVGKLITRAADIAASILKGKKAGEIPVEQPTEFEFAINLKTAKELGIKVPRSLLLRADQVIE